jgi:hypothetical protein
MNTGGLAQMSSNNFASSHGGRGNNPLGGLASRRGGQNLKPLSFDGINNNDTNKENAIPTPRTSRGHLLAGLRTAPKTSTATSFGPGPLSPLTTQPGHVRSMQNGASAHAGDAPPGLYGNYPQPPQTALPQLGGSSMRNRGFREQQQLQSQQTYEEMHNKMVQDMQNMALQTAQANAFYANQNNAYLQQNSSFNANQGNNGYQNTQSLSYHAADAYQREMTAPPFDINQILAPPEVIARDQLLREQGQDMDPRQYEQLVATNLFLAEQQQRLQAQLRSVQAVAQKHHENGTSHLYPAVANAQMLYWQHGQDVAASAHNLDAQSYQDNLRALAQLQYETQPGIVQASMGWYTTPDGRQYIDTVPPMHEQMKVREAGVRALKEQEKREPGSSSFSAWQQGGPRVQVSPPNDSYQPGGRRSPPKQREPLPEVTPLPPPSANAFRRGHKKASSIAPLNSALSNLSLGDSGLNSAGLRYPQTPGGYGPGQARAGEHPVRQPKGPPSMDELKATPTSKHEGSKNFATRTRRSVVTNLRAGMVRRKGTGSSAGSMSPVSEIEEESTTPITDNESDSGRSGSGTLAGEEECATGSKPSSTYGVIGSERKNSGSESSVADGENASSFAFVFKHGSRPASAKTDEVLGRAGLQDARHNRLVLTSSHAEKRKLSLSSSSSDTV